MAANAACRLRQMRLQHADIRQVGGGQQQIRQAGGNVLPFEMPGQASTRHQMTTRVKLGARRDNTAAVPVALPSPSTCPVSTAT